MHHLPLMLVAILTLTSCSLFQAKKVDLSDSYVTGLGLATDIAAEQIKKNLTRTKSMGGGNYIITTYPYTPALIQALARETARIRGLTTDQQEKLQRELERQWAVDKTCFQIEIQIKRFHDQVSQLKEWNLSASTGNEMKMELAWRAQDLERPIIVSEFSDFQGQQPLHLLNGVACSAMAINLVDGVTLHFTPQYINFPFPKTEQITYSFDNYKMQAGELIKVKEAQEKKRKSYRGW